MAEVLNAIPMPGVNRYPQQGEDNILYSTANLVKIGGTFAADPTAGPNGDGILPMGTVIKLDGKKYGEYKAGTEDVAVGILLDNIDISDSDQLANFAIGGEFYADKIVGIDAKAIEDMGAVEVTLSGTKVLRV